jgi:hypothetical protein
VTSWLGRLFGAGAAGSARNIALQAPAKPGVIVLDGQESDLGKGCREHDGLPHLNWRGVHRWIETRPEVARPALWNEFKRGWLLLLASTLGDGYLVYESDHALVLSRQPSNQAGATLEFVGNAMRRVKKILEELAHEGHFGKQMLLVFPDLDAYYRYIGYYYPEEGTFPMSAGVFLGGRHGGHFVVHGEKMWDFEPTIVHELTHSLLSHLHIPVWLDEGMAVNSEERLTRRGDDIWEVRELEAGHRKFWTPDKIQDFWSGKAYKRPGEGNKLAYDLGRILVNGMSSDWPRFKRFAAQAAGDDGGDAAARDLLDLDLGEMVRHFLRAPPGDWGPAPGAWKLESEDEAEEEAVAPSTQASESI